MPTVVFIVGSPRSGTTLLENILGSHPNIADWYEPYYVWEKYLSCQENDILQPRNPSEKTKDFIRNEYKIFGDKSKKNIVLDKNPGHVFNIEIIHGVFPDARWIHLVRDGRDVTLSIKKEWDKRKQVVEKKDFFALLRIARFMLKRQPYVRYNLMALTHELRGMASINPFRYLNKSRWKGKIGWGPRFEGWEEYLQTHPVLQFNAMQWVKSIEAAEKGCKVLPKENLIEVRYENLLQNPQHTLKKIMEFLDTDINTSFFDSIPRVQRENLGKWKNEFTPQELGQIKPILNPWLKKLGYWEQRPW